MADVPEVDDVGENLLRAASDVLAAEGPSALTVRRIAADAGMSTINVYSRFGNKDGLVEHLYIQGFERLTAAMSEVSVTADPLADLAECGVAYRRFALDNPTLYSVMFLRAVPDFTPSPAAVLIAGGTLDLLAARVSACMAAGMFAPADPLLTAATIWSVSHGVMSLEMNHAGPPTIVWEHVFTAATAAVKRGLMP